MKKIVFLFALALACVAFSAEKTFAAESKGNVPAIEKVVNKDNVSPKTVRTTITFIQCVDGSYEPVMSVITFTNTVGSQTVTTTVVSTRAPSPGCVSYEA